MPEPMYTLSGDSLRSKWGFGDGDGLSDWWWDNFEEDPPFDDHNMLYTLVVAYLLPALREQGWAVEITRIETLHNPVRASRINDMYVEDGWYDPRHPEHPIDDIEVGVTRTQIEALAFTGGTENTTPTEQEQDR